MVASFEHSLLREQRLADGRVVEIPNVATVHELERFVETEAKVALRGAAAAAQDGRRAPRGGAGTVYTGRGQTGGDR